MGLNVLDFFIDWINSMLNQLEGGVFAPVVQFIKLILVLISIFILYDQLEQKRKKITKTLNWLIKEISKLRD